MFRRTPSSVRAGETRTWFVVVLTAIVCFALAVPLTTVVLLGLGVAGLHHQAELEARDAEMMAVVAREQEMAARAHAEEALLKADKSQQAAAEALLRAERQLYFSRIALAQSEWQGHQPARARQVLDDCPAPFRDWEWQLLNKLTRTEPLAIKCRAAV